MGPSIPANLHTVADDLGAVSAKALVRALQEVGIALPELTDGSPLAPSAHPVAAHHRAVAEVWIGPVRLRVHGLHRSHLLEILDPERTTTYFVPGTPGATAVMEDLLARTVHEAGLPPDHVLGRPFDDAADLTAVEYSRTDGSTVVERTGTMIRIPVHTRYDHPPLAWSEREPVDPHLADLADLADVSTPAVIEALTPVAFANCVVVQEIWRSTRGEARREYLLAPGPPVDPRIQHGRQVILPGEQARATLDDGPPSPVVDVDAQGHLYDPRRATHCPVCAAAFSRCCDSEVGIGRCTTCTRPACADCRASDHPAVPDLTCERCRDFSCIDCGRDLPLLSCTGCEREVCPNCRPTSDLCLDCEYPQRWNERDADQALGWRLGGDTLLLIGARHASVIQADGTRVDLVPDDVQDDPFRARVRALALRLNQPLGAELVECEPAGDPDELIEGALWSHVQQSHWWTWSTETLDSITNMNDLPVLPDVPVQGEHESGLAELVAALRDQDPPPAPTALAAMPFLVAQRLDVVDGAFVYREAWRDGRQEPMPAATVSEPLRPSDHAVDASLRAVAAADLGPASVRVHGVHRSYLLEIIHDEQTTTFFVPGAVGATPEAELRRAASIQAAGLSADHVLGELPVDETERSADYYSHAAADNTVTRTESIVPIAVLAPIEPALDDSPDDDSTILTDPAVTAVLSKFSELLTPVAFVDGTVVREAWAGPHGTARREYLIAPGPPVDAGLLEARHLVLPGEVAQARLDDGMVGDGPVAVDAQGHLYCPERARACPICAEIYCAACDTAVADCATCDRPVCGRCRENRRPDIAATRCERCADFSCADCGRDRPVGGCGLCGRTVCTGSLVDDLCQTCAALRPATAEEVSALPAPLLATGLTVLIGHDPGGSVVVLAGTHRREVAWCSGPDIRRWETIQPDSPALLQVRMLACQLVGVGEVEVRLLATQLPLDDPAILVLEHEAGSELLWEIQVNGQHRCGTARSPQGEQGQEVPELLLTRAATLLMPPGSGRPYPRIPEPASPQRLRIIQERLAEVATQPVIAAVVLCDEPYQQLTGITPDGLLQRLTRGVTVQESIVPWSVPDTVPEWARSSWVPAPDVIALVGTGTGTAVVTAV
jgi:hypothetical protein